MVEVECGGFVFTSNFESGNLARVEQVNPQPKPSVAAPASSPNAQLSNNALEVPDYEFNIWTNPDCSGTEFENGNRSWFYFGVRGGTPLALVKFNLVNLNRQVKMYSQGMAPVFRVLPGRGLWDRIRDKPSYTIEDNVFTLTFRYRTLENTKATSYFAFTFPYSYQDLMSALKNFDKRFRNVFPPEKYLPGQLGPGVSADDIYYHRELAINSLDGRRLDLLTISSHHGITPHREPRFKNLFPDLDTLRPYIFTGKKVIFVSARVHPGEVPSSYVLNGFIEALLSREDLTSVLLRRMYVFKIIPMLNPDGVARGHFRTDTRGVNLNRVYTNPSLELHPTIYAARAIIKYAHYGREVPDEPEITEAKSSVANSSGSPSSTHLKEPNRANSIQRTHSTHSLPQTAAGTCCSSHSLRSTISLPQSLDNAHQSGNPGVVPFDNIDAEHQVLIDVGKSNDNEEHGNKGIFCAGFPSEPILAPKSNEADCELREVETNLKSSQSALELSFRNVMNVSAQSEPAHQCAAEDGGQEVVKNRKIMRRKHHSTGSARLLKRQVTLSSVDDFAEDALKVNSLGCTNAAPAKPTLDPTKSGLFLYMDMHGHASKKGIFMYGNHFDDLDQLVECMLLPKIMSINSQNFHFNACNFTERNMYLRDRRDGMSREGCGRVSVMKMTGVVRSYTLECNYNTGRIVNLLPPCVRDYARMAVNVAYAVPPKYTPLVFEDVGRALAVSILDVTSSNPCSRIPNSDYRSVNGIRDWLRSNCMSDNQIWSRMLHRPIRQSQQQPLQVDALCKISGSMSPNAILDDTAELTLNWHLADVEQRGSVETVNSLNNCDRSYNRSIAFQYERELELERQRILERLKSERLKALEKESGENMEKKSDLKLLLEEELLKKREIVRKVREHEKILREKFNKLFPPKTLLKPKESDEGRTEDEEHLSAVKESRSVLQEEINEIVVAMARIDEITSISESWVMDPLVNVSREEIETQTEELRDKHLKGVRDKSRIVDRHTFPKVGGRRNTTRWRNILETTDILKGGGLSLRKVTPRKGSSKDVVHRLTKRRDVVGKDGNADDCVIETQNLALNTPEVSVKHSCTSTAVDRTSPAYDELERLSPNQRLKVREFSGRALTHLSKSGSKILLTYCNQTDCDMGDVILHELRRRENSNSRVRRDDLFAVVGREREQSLSVVAKSKHHCAG